MDLSKVKTIPLSTQVGGHAGVTQSEDGSLLIKPAHQRELEFYELLSSSSEGPLNELKEYTPAFYGKLTYQGKTEGGLEEMNLSWALKKPCILDIKLGTILYDDGASPEKQARMIETARNTTSFETGVRLTGFQVYDNITNQAVNTPKSYGKSIKAADLPEGIAKFFSIGKPIVNGETTNSIGLPPSSLLRVLKGLHEETQQIRDALGRIEFRMVGGSLLLLYEGDWAQIESSLDDYDKAESTESEEDEDSEEKKAIGVPYLAKLIDFAHTKLTPGEGPDEGVLLGLDTVLKLLDQRIEQVAAEL